MTVLSQVCCRLVWISVMSLGPLAPALAAAGLEGERGRQESRTVLQSKLEEQGLDAEEAKSRVASLTDAEVEAVSGQVETLPAGGDSSITIGVGSAIIIALLLIIFL